MPDGGQLRETWARIAADPRPARPWRDGAAFPWADPVFSERMLRLHLDQSTHMASRSLPVIRAHVGWLEDRLAEAFGDAAPRRVLDVACGPGLYCHELARRGHRAWGCDVAPAALRHAREAAASEGLACGFHAADLEDPDAPLPPDITDLDAVTLWYGEVHAHPPGAMLAALTALAARLRPGGLMILEYQPWELYPREDLLEWRACEGSPFADGPHFWLQEYHWDEASQSEINVHWIVDPATGAAKRYAQSGRAWRDEDLAGLCAAAGLVGGVFLPPVTGVDARHEFAMLISRR
ncbi:MAG: class I SAM-dependent methyltransferase [Candidatus Latescibacteria bacterium]|nr:class I SAM-dependent methyltransferase [Candidatus Latescibacterota bacterium]